MTEAIETIKKKRTLDRLLEIYRYLMNRQFQRGENNEETNAKYRTLLAKYYENQFKPKSYERRNRIFD